MGVKIERKINNIRNEFGYSFILFKIEVSLS